jgi:hypothetical protein
MRRYKCQILGCETEALSWVPRGSFGTILCYEHTMEFVERMSKTEMMVMVYPVGWVLPMLGNLDLWEECPSSVED